MPQRFAAGARKLGMTVLAAAAAQVFAQTQAAPAAADGDAAKGSAAASSQPAKRTALETVVVTAQKVLQPASKTPLALSVVGGEDLRESGITDARGLTDAVPNVNIAQESGKLQIAIRGVVSLDMTEKGDPSAAFNVDGAYVPRYEAQIGAFMDLERVEILRGPQGTLYGRNATAGVVNLITRKPTDKFGGRVELSAGNYGAYSLEGVINAPINEMLSLRAVAQKSQRDGYIRPAGNTGTPMDKRDDYAGRVHLLAKLGKDSSLLLTAETSHQGGGAPTPVPMGNFFSGTFVDNLPFSPPNTGNNISNPVYVDRGAEAQLTARLNFKGASNPARTDNTSNALRAEYKTDLGFGEFTYQLARLTSRIDGSGNGIYFGFPIVLTGKGDSTATSHELRLNSTGSGPLRWVAGAYLFDEDIARVSSFNTFITAPFGAFTVTLPFDIKVNNKSRALFGQATYSITPDTRVTLGLRETKDQKHGIDKLAGVAAVAPATTSTGAYDKTVKFSNTSFRLGLDHDLAAGVMAYASMATGYKSGGFNDTSDGGDYKPEHLRSLEVGLKGRFLEDHLHLNASVFHYDYKDMQLTSVVCRTADPSSCGSLTTNAGRARIQGAELEARWMPSDDGEFRASLALTEAKFRNYKPTATVDWSGQYLDRTPRKVLTLAYTHHFPLASGGEVSATLGQRISSSYTISDDAAAIRYAQPTFHKSDASLGWTDAKGSMGVQLFVKNVENKITIESRVPGSFFVGDPRTYGIRANYSF